MIKFTKIMLLMLLFLLQGCNNGSSTMPNTIHYYLDPSKSLSQTGRIAIIELENSSDYPAISYDITNSLHRSLQKTQLFGISVISKENSIWSDLKINANDKYTLEQLSEIRKTINCNAMLTGTITQYTPYPHTTVALILKLTDLRDGKLIWAMEQIFDSSDKTTEARIEKYLQAQNNTKTNTIDAKLITISPVKFIDFVTYEVASTMIEKNK
ncbi:MAG TPA: hypothetical protein PLP05_01285 [Sedimentisphaerales bacterium]|nr:hypothetical protein [Sedimentisphaerales bacterium]